MSYQTALEIKDPEILAELLKLQTGAKKLEEVTKESIDAYLQKILKLGCITLKAASGQIDAGAVKEAGAAIIGDLKQLLQQYSTDMIVGIGSALKEHFDPDTGQFTQHVRNLTVKGGSLHSLLHNLLIADNSPLAEAIAEHVGDNSPIMQMLSPNNRQGLVFMLQESVSDVLTKNRENILAEFSLDRSDSALSRLVKEVRDSGKEVTQEFSLDREDSALSKLVQRIERVSKEIAGQFSLDKEESAINKLLEAIQDQSNQNADFYLEVRETLAELKGKKASAEASTLHGFIFEEALGNPLREIASGLGDILEHTGNTTGIIKNNKKGDFVITLSPESQAPGARIVWEAKESKSYNLKAALDEIEEARKNREAQIGIFVFSSKTVPEGIRSLDRFGNDITVVWNAVNSPVSDIILRAAYSLARALSFRTKASSEEHTAIVQQLGPIIRDIEKQVGYLADIIKWTDTIRNNSNKLFDRASRMSETLLKNIEKLDQTVAKLQ